MKFNVPKDLKQKYITKLRIARAKEDNLGIRYVIDRSLEALGVKIMKTKKIQWSEIKEPDEECSYTHVIGSSPLGDFRIIWRSWKAQPSFDTEHEIKEFKNYGAFGLYEAKTQAQLNFDRLVQSCLEEEQDEPNRKSDH